MNFNWFDIAILIIVVFSFFKGYFSGLIMQLASLVGLLCCAFFAGHIATLFLPLINAIISNNEYAIKAISYIIAFAAIMVVFMIIGKILENFLRLIQINFLNKIAGSFFSVIKWLFIVSLVLNLFTAFDTGGRILKNDVKENSLTYSYIINLAPRFIPFLNFEIPLPHDNSNKNLNFVSI